MQVGSFPQRWICHSAQILLVGLRSTCFQVVADSWKSGERRETAWESGLGCRPMTASAGSVAPESAFTRLRSRIKSPSSVGDAVLWGLCFVAAILAVLVIFEIVYQV